MNYTSIDQSKKLSDLGLSKDTADMCYWMQYHRAIDGGGQHLEDRPSIGNGNKESIPCWSTDALLNMMPSIMRLQSHGYTIHIGKLADETNWYISYEWEGHVYQVFKGTLIEAAYSTVSWLLEEGHIKKEK